MRILVQAPGRISEAVLAVPALRSLAGGYPGARVTVVASPMVAALYRRAAGMEDVRVARSGLARTCRRERFDLGVTLTASFSSALFLFLAGARRRVGYDTGKRSVLLTDSLPVEPTFGMHLSEQYYHLALQAGGCHLPSCELLSVSDPDRRAADHLLRQNGVDPRQPFLALAPGTRSPRTRGWSPERYADLALRVVERYGWPVVVVGSPADGPMVSMVADAGGPGVVDLAGRTTLSTLGAVLHRSRLLVTNDSSAMHIAAGVGSKVVALFGSTDPGWTSPLGEGHRIVYHELSCSPCLQDTCAVGTVCLSSIRTDEVLAQVQQSLLTHWRVVPVEPAIVPSPVPATEPSEDDRPEEPPFRIIQNG